MIVQNNHSPLVFLVLVILGGAVLLGLLLTGTEIFNPTRVQQEAYAESTKAALEAKVTQAAWSGTQTQQAISGQYAQTLTAIPMQATAIPAQQTAGAATAISQATARAQHVEEWMSDQMFACTATTLSDARQQDAMNVRNARINADLKLVMMILLVVALLLVIILFIGLSVKLLRP